MYLMLKRCVLQLHLHYISFVIKCSCGCSYMCYNNGLCNYRKRKRKGGGGTKIMKPLQIGHKVN